jgi:hypothetical protein
LSKPFGVKEGYVMPNLIVVMLPLCFWKHAALRLLKFWPTVLPGERKKSYENYSSSASRQTNVPQEQLHVNVPENSRPRAHIRKSRPYQRLTKRQEI